MVTVAFADVSRRYAPEGALAVDSFDLAIEDGELMVLVGPSGSGKSTCLRMLAGLEPVDSGRIWIGDRDVTDVAINDRDIAMVFQNYALYPHLSVADNLGFALHLQHVQPEELRRRVHAAANLLGLSEFLERKPSALSGGQRQRVAMGRAIVRSPQVFCMDEPLSNLDAQLRAVTRTEISALQERLGVTTVYVTHDQVEAMTMGDRIAVLRSGVLQQVGVPRAVYERPANVFVAGFVGTPRMNLLDARVDGDCAELYGWTTPLPRATAQRVGHGSRLVVGIRPEHVDLSDDLNVLRGCVERVEDLGSDVLAHVSLLPAQPVGEAPTLIVRVRPERAPHPGSTVGVAPRPTELHFFDPDSGQRLPNDSGV